MEGVGVPPYAHYIFTCFCIFFVSRWIYTGVALIYSSQPNNLMRFHT